MEKVWPEVGTLGVPNLPNDSVRIDSREDFFWRFLDKEDRHATALILGQVEGGWCDALVNERKVRIQLAQWKSITPSGIQYVV